MRRVSSLLFILFLFSCVSCAYVKKTEVKTALDQTQEKLRSGEFQDALDTCEKVYKKYPKDPAVLKNYIEAIELVKARGDQAFDKENFREAQGVYDLLLKNFPRFSTFADQLSFKRNFLATRLKMSRLFQTEKLAQSFLRGGDLQRAIDAYSVLAQQYPRDQAVGSRFASLLESIKEQGDVDFERQDFASAGRIYRTLLKNYPSVRPLHPLLSYDAGFLNRKVENCRKILFEEGLRQYRSGNLNRAISIWGEILSFDPENQEAKKAKDKATLQAGNLERVKSEPLK